MLNVTFDQKNSLATHDTIVILVDDQLKLGNISSLDQISQSLITKTLTNKSLFKGSFGQKVVLTTVDQDDKLKFIIILGIGDSVKLKISCLEMLGGKIIPIAKEMKLENLTILIPDNLGQLSQELAAALLGSGALLASYKFDKYFTQQKEEQKFQVKSLNIITNNATAAENLFKEKELIAQGVFLARDCISEPPNILNPKSYVQVIIKELSPFNVQIDVLGEKEMKGLGMGALLGVGQGSENESQLVVMKYNNNISKSEASVALVGKGVMFDSGGISLKPSLGMADMKYDMAGSAAVVGTIKALAASNAKVNVVGVIGLVENMPSGSAQRPSDVVTTMSGQTAEVLDTDAEGRLVLADAVWYAQDKFNPTCVIDVATLTGAITVALGNTYAGLFANDDEIANKLIEAGEIVNEKLWRMPLHKDYDDMIKSAIADVANLGNVRGAAGSSTAAHFIQRFIKDGVKWAHLDIAGMAWEKNGSAICPKGATGYGVRLLNKFILENYGSK